MNVNRINQDIAENAFGIVRSIGKYNQTLNPVDVKYRLQYRCLCWHLLVPRPTFPVLNGDNGDDDEVIFSTKISLLMIGNEKNYPSILEYIEEQFEEYTVEDLMCSEDWTKIVTNLSSKQNCEFGGQEMLVGYITKKLKSVSQPGLT